MSSSLADAVLLKIVALADGDTITVSEGLTAGEVRDMITDYDTTVATEQANLVTETNISEIYRKKYRKAKRR